MSSAINEFQASVSKAVESLKTGSKDLQSVKEMAIEIFDGDDRDYQLRYFNDQVDSTIEFYELKEILYVKKVFKKIEW